MPPAAASFGWQEAAAAFAIIAVVASLVTWVITDVAHVSRTPFVAILTLTTLALTAGYLAWSGTSLTELVTTGWGVGILAGALVAAVISPGVRRLPAGSRPEGTRLAGLLVWDGVVYGTAEALLLATLPVLAVWQAAAALGWTETSRGRIASGALAVIGALFVIAVHHLGYREFRGRSARKKLIGALVGCGVQALAFLVTGSVLAPIVAHITLHGQMIFRGVELPPAAGSGRDHQGADHARTATAEAVGQQELVASGA